MSRAHTPEMKAPVLDPDPWVHPEPSDGSLTPDSCFLTPVS